MRLRAAIILTSALLAGGVCAAPAAAQGVSAAAEPGRWVIGPIIGRRNYSVAMPLHPTPRRGGGFHIDLPNAPGSAHYVTFRHGSLAGKRQIRIRYRVQVDPGARIVATTVPKWPGLITPYFQRAGDNWTGRGRFETYRWYGTFATKVLEPGQFEIVAPLTSKWTAVETSNALTAPGRFRDAAVNADQVGFVLGGGDGFGHGVHVVGGRARLIVTDFQVE